MATTYYSSDKDVNEFVAQLVRKGWRFQRKGGHKHAKLITPGGRKTTVPHSPSDWRALRNLRRETARMEALPADATAQAGTVRAARR